MNTLPSGPRFLVHVAGCLIAGATVVAPSIGFAQPADAPAEPPEDPTPEGPVTAPDDARGWSEEPGVEGEDVALFVPRAVLFFPGLILRAVYLPIRAGLDVVERHHVIEEVEDFLYNDERTAAIVPVISLSTFTGAEIGARAFHDDLGGNGEHGSIRAAFGGRYNQAYEVAFRADNIGHTPFWVESYTTYESAPQELFQGIGDRDGLPTSGSGFDGRAAAVESYFQHDRFRQIGTIGAALPTEGMLYKLGTTGRLKRHKFGRGRNLADDETSIDDAYDVRTIPGLLTDATVFELEGSLVLDGRDKAGATSSGLYAEAYGGGALPVGDFGYAKYGGEITGFIDLYRGTRVLVLRLAHEAVVGDEEEIPFVELATLGGAHRLRGYPVNRFRDEKALLGTVEYRYPIHELLSGRLYVDIGEVAPTYEDLFDEPEIRVGGGGGFIVHTEDSVLLTFDLAGGDEGIQAHATTDPLRAFADRDSDL